MGIVIKEVMEINYKRFKLFNDNQGQTLVIVIVICLVIGLASLWFFVGGNNNFKAHVLNQKTSPEAVIPSPNYTELKGQLAAGFPQFPVYPSAELEESHKKNDAIENMRGYSANWMIEGNHSVTEVMNWYRTELIKAGWTIKETGEENNSIAEQTIKALKADQAAVVIIEKGEKDDPNEIEVLVDIPTQGL